MSRRRQNQSTVAVPNKRRRLKKVKEEPKDPEEEEEVNAVYWNFCVPEDEEIQIEFGEGPEKSIQLLYNTPTSSAIDIHKFFRECALMVRCVDKSQVISSLIPHYGQVLARNRNINPNMFPEKRTKNFFDYSNKTIVQRQQRWKEECVVVMDHDDQRLWYEDKNRTLHLCKTTPILKDGWNALYEQVMDMQNRSFQRASKYLELTKEDQEKIMVYGEDCDIPEELGKYHSRLVYEAPKRRIRITTDISWVYDEDHKYKIPVYSDIPGETPENIEIPDNFCFDYINNNIVDRNSEPLLSEILRHAKKEHNHIKCNCEPGARSCFGNPECPCFRMNKALEKMNTVNDNSTSFCPTKPLNYYGHAPDFFGHAAFACSEICGCIGSCNNNVLATVQGKVFAMEVFREDKTIGFGLRSTSLIPPGVPVIEFCGEVMKSGRLDEDLKSYSLQLSARDGEDNLLRVVEEDSGFSESYLRQLKNCYHVTAWQIDCKWQGNCSRFIMNSCTPNLEPIRVFQKSFSPAHAKVVMFSMKPIFPGEQFSFDYGPTYHQAGGTPFVCQCGSFACKNGPDAEIFTKMGVDELTACFSELHQVSAARFVKSIKKFLTDGRDEIPTWPRNDNFENTPNYYRIYQREVRGDNRLIGFHRFRHELLTELDRIKRK